MNRCVLALVAALLVAACAFAQGAKDYDPGKLHHELEEAGLAITGCDSSGRVSWQTGHPTPDEAKTCAAICAVHDPKADRCDMLWPLVLQAQRDLSASKAARDGLAASGAMNLDVADAKIKAAQFAFDALANRWRLAKK